MKRINNTTQPTDGNAFSTMGLNAGKYNGDISIGARGAISKESGSLKNDKHRRYTKDFHTKHLLAIHAGRGGDGTGMNGLPEGLPQGTYKLRSVSNNEDITVTADTIAKEEAKGAFIPVRTDEGKNDSDEEILEQQIFLAGRQKVKHKPLSKYVESLNARGSASISHNENSGQVASGLKRMRLLQQKSNDTKVTNKDDNEYNDILPK